MKTRSSLGHPAYRQQQSVNEVLAATEGESRRPEAYLGIQALRGFAAVMVVIFHATQMWTQRVGTEASPGAWKNGAVGVDIFFVISGFVMAVSTIGKEDAQHPARTFMERRLVRLVPLYWIVTLVVLLKLWFVRGHTQFANSAQTIDLSWGFVLCSFLFIPFRNSLGVIQPLLFVGWTLSFEMFFYSLFALALALRMGIAKTLTPVMIVLVVVGSFRTEHWPAVTSLTKPYLLEFLAGLLLGHAILKGWRTGVRSSAVLGGLSAAALICAPTFTMFGVSFLQWALPAYFVVQAIVMSEHHMSRFWPRWTLLLGDASYSLYLSHPLAFAFTVKLLSHMHVLTPGVVRRKDEVVCIVVSLAVAIVAALLLYWMVERPTNRWLRRRLVRREYPCRC